MQSENIKNEWKGVTLDELRFMRASSLIRLEIQKEYLKKKMGETLPFNTQRPGTLMSEISNKLSFAQKALLFFKGIKLTTSLISFFRKSKRR